MNLNTQDYLMGKVPPQITSRFFFLAWFLGAYLLQQFCFLLTFIDNTTSKSRQIIL